MSFCGKFYRPTLLCRVQHLLVAFHNQFYPRRARSLGSLRSSHDNFSHSRPLFNAFGRKVCWFDVPANNAPSRFSLPFGRIGDVYVHKTSRPYLLVCGVGYACYGYSLWESDLWHNFAKKCWQIDQRNSVWVEYCIRILGPIFVPWRWRTSFR